MDKGEIAGAIIGILMLVAFFGTIIVSGIQNDKEKEIKEQVYINLLLENERLKVLQEQNQ